MQEESTSVFQNFFWHSSCKMIHTGILKSWYVKSVNSMVVLTFLCKRFYMCIPAVLTLVFYELFLPYIQLGKRSVLVWISVCNNRNSASGHPCKKPGSILFAPSLWVCRYIDEVPWSQTLNLSLWPSIGLSSTSMSLLLRSAEPDTAFQVWPHQHWAEGQHLLPCLAASTPPNAAHNTICLLCCRGTFLAHGQCSVHQDTYLPFLPGFFPAVLPPLWAGAWSCSSPRARLGPSLVWTMWSSCQPVQVSPDGSTAPLAHQLLLPVWCHLQLY